ncbi:MAG: hypothetical protein JWP00_1089 [Chloroflexi bacterium]|jgi:uncharacterized protein (DUF1330 family)|nr:hypothetical protein [Chloroflexota bacterium]
MAAYIIAVMKIEDFEAYKEYSKLVPASLDPYGGKFIARGGKHEFLEGPLPASRVVIIEFESYEKAQGWYNSDDYQAARLKRQAVANGSLIIVEGV